MKRLNFILSLATTLLLGACSDATINPDLPGSTAPTNGPPDARAKLETLGDTDAFYSALKDALINQSVGYDTDDSLGAEVEFAPSAPESAPVAAGDSAADSAVEAAVNEVSTTNVQEIGVDEQDRVKLNAQGTRLFVLHTEYGYFGGIDEPVFIQEPAFPGGDGSGDAVDFPQNTSESSSPELMPVEPPDGETRPEEPEPLPVETSPLIEPFPQETSTTLRILSLDSETPDATSLKDLSLDLDGHIADGFYLYETGAETSAIVTASGGGFWGYWGDSVAFSGLQSVIAKVDVGDAASAAVVDTFTIDGQIISSRRIGDSLFFASRYYPVIPGVQPWQQTADQWREAVESADLAGLMPEYSREGSDQTTPLVKPAACFVAPVSADDPYYSPDIITLGVIDLATMQLRDSECFLGATETLYANTESVFLATTQYSYAEGPVTMAGEAVDVEVNVFDTDIAWFDPRTSTDIHQFDIEGDQLSYAGSGSVRGHLGWNDLQKPFRMSESNGYLRVATMNDQQGPDHSPILLNILQADGTGNLEIVSTLPNESRPKHIGEPGERLYASRFIGERAYLVTFRQTDPLYVIDLADPADPEITGELKIDGYSDYLQPVDENFILGIGKDAVASTDGRGDGRGAWVQGIKLSLFDVSDPTAPAEVKSVLVGERGTDSVALRNHRAIMVQPATDQHPMRVSFGIDVYGDPNPVSSPPPSQALNYANWNYTGLHGFDVTAGANANIIPRGALIVERSDGSPWYTGEYGDDRSVMVNDAVFYVHGKSVYPALWDNLGSVPPAR